MYLNNAIHLHTNTQVPILINLLVCFNILVNQDLQTKSQTEVWEFLAINTTIIQTSLPFFFSSRTRQATCTPYGGMRLAARVRAAGNLYGMYGNDTDG